MTQSPFLLPTVPREITRRVRQRAWADPRVRFWWLAAAALLLVGVGFVINGLRERAHEAWLIRDGLLIDARVDNANGEYLKHRPEPPYSTVQLKFPWHGKEYQPPARPLENRTEFITTDSILPIHVNPDNPDDWTWLDKPMPMFTHIVGLLVVLPLSLFAMLWAVAKRRITLHLWRDGTMIEALIVETRHVAVAPQCRVARVTPIDENDQRVYTVYLPGKLKALHEGDGVWILLPPDHRGTAAAMAWFD